MKTAYLQVHNTIFNFSTKDKCSWPWLNEWVRFGDFVANLADEIINSKL